MSPKVLFPEYLDLLDRLDELLFKTEQHPTEDFMPELERIVSESGIAALKYRYNLQRKRNVPIGNRLNYFCGFIAALASGNGAPCRKEWQEMLEAWPESRFNKRRNYHG